MKHQRYNPDFSFYREPEEFNRDSDMSFLKYCLGAALYMPAYQDFATIVLTRKYKCLTTMVVCFEDAIDETQVSSAEKSAVENFERLYCALKDASLLYENLPLIFCRARSVEQFYELKKIIDPKYYDIIAGYVFPKFSSKNGNEFFKVLNEINSQTDHKVYGMPLLEGTELAEKETRISELMKVKSIIDKNKDYVLNVRVGATDFSSVFGARRGVDYTIYDIITVADCLLDILNTFTRYNDYVVSGPVWEYFSSHWSNRYEKKFEPIDKKDKSVKTIIHNDSIVDSSIDGLIRETLLDIANGFTGKTSIHPSHIRYINALQAVSREEYEDACQILDTSGGVIKSKTSNKMNEIKPHTNWANRILMRARAYGVLENGSDFFELVEAPKR